MIFSRESAQSNFASLTRFASQVFVVRICVPGLDVVVVDLLDEVGLGDGEGRARALGGGAAGDEERPHRPVGEEDVGLQALADVLLHGDTPSEDEGAFRGFRVRSASISSLLRPCRSGNWHLPPAPGDAARPPGEEPVAAASQGPSLRRS